MHSSPVCHFTTPKSLSFDLHVLGAPPAFVLSQDQTLKSYFIFKGRHFNTLVVLFFLTVIQFSKTGHSRRIVIIANKGYAVNLFTHKKKKFFVHFNNSFTNDLIDHEMLVG